MVPSIKQLLEFRSLVEETDMIAGKALSFEAASEAKEYFNNINS